MIWKDRIVYLDVAHNEHGFLAIIDRVKQLTDEVTIVCGFSKNKDVENILELMSNPIIKSVYPVSCNHFRL